MLFRKILRTLRTRILLWTILTVAIVYFVVNVTKQVRFSGDKEKDRVEEADDTLVRSTFQWHQVEDDNRTSSIEVTTTTCRNSVQGKSLLADDRGYLCARHEVLPSGCCDVDSAKRYACDTCHENHCCSVYEFCVSCCLQPDKKSLLQDVLDRASGNFHLLFSTITDHYELCLVVCRTSSQSVQHENSYRDPRCAWLNGCGDVLCKSGSPLDEVIEKTATELASRLQTEFHNGKDEKRRHIMYSLLGFSFVSKHFPNSNYDPQFLERLPALERKSLLEEAKAIIGAHLERIIEKQNNGKPLTEYSSETPLGSFVKQSRTVFEEGVNRQMQDAKKIKVKQSSREKLGKLTSAEDGEVEIWENEMDIMSQALVEVCRHEPQRSKNLLRVFRDRNYSLPSPLRILFLKEFVLTKEKDKFRKEVGLSLLDEAWRTQFAKTVRRHSVDLTADGAIRSPLWQQIDTAVKETYDRVAGLRLYDTDDQQIEAVRVLNILQVYNKLYDPILVLWLFPLQLTFGYSTKETDLHVMELAMFLEPIARHCIPPPDRIFKMAEKVIGTWRDWDSDLYADVQKALKKSIWINAKDFPAQTLHPNRSEANKLFVKLKGKSRNDIPHECLGILTDPTVFVRKWIVEGFASAVNRNALRFVWDQLMYHEWSEKTFVNVCLALLFLLKSRFIKAKNYFGVREIFVSDVGRLYTADVRKAVVHVQNGKSFDDIPIMNRNTEKEPANRN